MINRGFTLIEVVVVVAIAAIMVALIVTDFLSVNSAAALDSNAQEISETLRFAQNRTLSSENSAQYGVYFDTPNNAYILYKGVNYANRDTSFDNKKILSKEVELSAVNFGGGNEVVFQKLTGGATQSGTVSVRLKTDVTQTKTVYVSANGLVSFEEGALPSDNSRVKDSRHTHFNYSRTIDTATENIVMNFNNGAVVRSYPISSYLDAGQIKITDTITVESQSQQVTFQSHTLNNSGSQLSVRRDRRYNTKPLKITISGDTTGKLIEYSADGTSVNGLTTADCSTGASGLSSYVSNCAWQ